MALQAQEITIGLSESGTAPSLPLYLPRIPGTQDSDYDQFTRWWVFLSLEGQAQSPQGCKQEHAAQNDRVFPGKQGEIATRNFTLSQNFSLFVLYFSSAFS